MLIIILTNAGKYDKLCKSVSNGTFCEGFMNNTSKEKIILSSDVFSFCSAKTLCELSDCETDTYDAGESIPKERASMLGLVLSGKFTIKSADGGRVLMKSVGAGEVFGAATVFLGGNDVSGITAAKRSEVLFVPRDVLEKIFADDSGFAVGYARFLSEKIEFLSKKIIALSSPRADVALAAILCEERGNGDEIKLNCAACAKKLGVGRTTLYRAIGTLEDDGIISYVDGRIIIRDAEKLASRRENI